MRDAENQLGYGQRLAWRKQAILKSKYGIEWKTVTELNPDVHCD